MGSTLAFLLGTLLEIASARQLYSGIVSGHDFALFACVHLTATGLITVGCHHFLPSAKKQAEREIILAYCALIVLCLPMLGAVTVTALLITLASRQGLAAAAWHITEIPELPARANGQGERYGEAALMGILCHSRNAEKRLRAVLAIRQLEPRAALPLLRRALTDTSEDVRLLAFSQLDSKQESLNQQIKDLLNEMDQNPDIIHDQNMLATMASRFWELVYLGYNNTQGDLSLLDRAREHLLRAIDHNPDNAELSFQIGRIELKLGNLDRARDAFTTAQRGGFCKDELMPYLAECAFLSGNYSDIRPLLDQIDERRRSREPFNALVAMWA
ncbi:MAG: tetratricopeptide repeat protein [Pseudomonadota bacterium]